MAKIVLVHGIAQEQYSADLLEDEWVPALVGGVRNAGYGAIADALNAAKTEIKMAFYGQLFLVPGRQGAPFQIADLNLSGSDADFPERLALEWLERGVAVDPGEQYLLSSVRSQPGRQQQGISHVKAQAVQVASKLKWFAPLGMGFAERFVNKSLAQVTRYLCEPAIRVAAQRSVLDLIGPETQIVIGHSLGSVVAFEALHKVTHRIPLLLTMGSPLGLKVIVKEKLEPQPPTYPPFVGRWVNVASPDDIVSAEWNLSGLFGNIPKGSTFESLPVNNGASPHSGQFYLGKVEVGRPIGDVLSSTGSDH